MNTITHALPIQVRDVDEVKREITFVASDETVDRYGTVIMVEGWELANYRKNPVFLFGHNYTSPMSVIGRTMKIEKDVGAAELRIRPQFVPKEINPLAEMAFQMYAHKPPFLNAVSVGFIPFETVDITEEEAKKLKSKIKPKLRFTKQDLLEVSAVVVPANPNAIMVDELIAQAKNAGIDAVSLMAARSVMPAVGEADEIQMLCERMERWVEQNGLVIPRAYAAEEELPAEATTEEERAWQIQSVLMPKKFWASEAAARTAVEKAGFRTDKVDETGDHYRYRQAPPENFTTMRTICLSPGKTTPMDECKMKAIVGQPKASVEPPKINTAEAVIMEQESEQRIGAVLSAKNKAKLKAAAAAIQEVLAAAEPAPAEEQSKAAIEDASFTDALEHLRVTLEQLIHEQIDEVMAAIESVREAIADAVEAMQSQAELEEEDAPLEPPADDAPPPPSDAIGKSITDMRDSFQRLFQVASEVTSQLEAIGQAKGSAK